MSGAQFVRFSVVGYHNKHHICQLDNLAEVGYHLMNKETVRYHNMVPYYNKTLLLCIILNNICGHLKYLTYNTMQYEGSIMILV